MKYPEACCAVCGTKLTDQIGWFCSQRCDDEEMNSRAMRATIKFAAATQPQPEA